VKPNHQKVSSIVIQLARQRCNNVKPRIRLPSPNCKDRQKDQRLALCCRTSLCSKCQSEETLASRLINYIDKCISTCLTCNIFNWSLRAIERDREVCV